jgi:hypothetical protein
MLKHKPLLYFAHQIDYSRELNNVFKNVKLYVGLKKVMAGRGCPYHPFTLPHTYILIRSGPDLFPLIPHL